MAQFDLGHLSDHLGDVTIRYCPRPETFRVDTESAHKGSPRKFARRQRSNYAVRRGIESLDVRNMRSHFGLEKLSNLPIKIRNVDLRSGGLVLRERTAACAKQSAKNQDNQPCGAEFGFSQE